MSHDTYVPPSYADRIRAAPPLKRLVLAALALLVSLAAAITAAVVVLDMPAEELPRLTLVLASAGTGALIAGGGFLWLLGNLRGRRISARLITAHIIGLLVVVVTTGISAAVLFESTHDFQILGLILAFSVAVAAIYSAFVSGWFTTPLSGLAAASRQLAEGELTVRLPDAEEKELADLGLAMNTMAGRLQYAYQRQRALEESQRFLVAAMIIELQEPWAALNRSAESLLRTHELDSPTVHHLGISLQRGLNRQGELIAELEELARIDAGQARIDPQPIELSGQILDACDKLGPQAAMLGVKLLPRVDFGISRVLFDVEHLRMVLHQLIDHAMRQGVSGDSVLIESLDHGYDAQVNIAVSGSPYGSRQTHYSVGVVVARRLIELNNGRVWTAQPLTGGLVTSFTLPKVAESA